MTPQHPTRQHYPALDGLRGTAILLIVAYHNFESIGIPGTNWIEWFGWISVDLFFVLSGFLITEILLKTIEEKKFLRNFYSRRVLRIFPLYYLSLFLFLLIIPQSNLKFNVEYYVDNQAWLWTYLQNWLFVFKAQSETDALNHFWTLAVEEQFYLLWPLAILLIKSPKYLLLLILSLFVLVPVLRIWLWEQQFPNLDYVKLFTFTRFDGICAGCTIALLQKIDSSFLKKRTIWIIAVIAVINSGFFFINQEYHLGLPYMASVGYPTVALMFGLLVYEGVIGRSKLITLIFQIPILRFFGKISYGFYIFHWPVYLLLKPFLQNWISKFASGSVMQFIISLLTTLSAIGISWLSYNYYEKYFLRMKRKFA